MRRLTRYVLFELLSVFAVTLTGITLLLILAGVATEGLREGIGLGPMLKMIPFVVPVALQVSVPATILMATSSVFGRMSADNEVVAIKSLGIPPNAILTPALVLAFVVSLVAVWINDIAVSWGRTGMYRVVVESVEEVAYRMLRTQSAFQSHSFSIKVRDVVGRKLIQPTIRIQSSQEGERIRIDAHSAELKSDPAQNTLKFELTNFNMQKGELSVWSNHDELTLSLDDATRKGDNRDSPSLVPLSRIAEEANRQLRVTQNAERLGATAAAFQMMTGDFAGLAEPRTWQQRQQSIEGARTRLIRLRLEPWRRWATGFSCFFFVMVGAPLAIRMKNANFFTTFAACFLPILLLYYPLLAFSVNRCKDGAVPPYTAWLGNLCLGLVGLWLIRRVVRY